MDSRTPRSVMSAAPAAKTPAAQSAAVRSCGGLVGQTHGELRPPASMVSVSTYGPFGEPERATGRWLPYLRLGAAVALTAVAVGALAAGAAGGTLPGGFLAMFRNVAGITGVGLLSAEVLGGMLAWAGPMAYLVLAETMLAGGRTSPWVWPTRAPHDLGAAVCAAGVFVAGALLITVRGPRESARD